MQQHSEKVKGFSIEAEEFQMSIIWELSQPQADHGNIII